MMMMLFRCNKAPRPECRASIESVFFVRRTSSWRRCRKSGRSGSETSGDSELHGGWNWNNYSNEGTTCCATAAATMIRGQLECSHVKDRARFGRRSGPGGPILSDV
jgi:hypothetical protein